MRRVAGVAVLGCSIAAGHSLHNKISFLSIGGEASASSPNWCLYVL